MMNLTPVQWVSHVVFHPFEGFENLRWKKAGSLKIALIIVTFLFAGMLVSDRLYGFQFKAVYDKVFNIVPYIVRSYVVFAAWVTGNWAVCSLINSEGTFRKICIYSSYALVPYVVQLYVNTAVSHILIQDEVIFMQCIYYGSVIWSALLMFSAVKAVHQYTCFQTILAVALTVAAMCIIMFITVLLMSLFQQVAIFIYELYTEIQYRIRV
ncbi:MAG: YIP1 family protein [Oscillospiraceae bacterium]|nr:YIP1 family protein [Oscillospiraceae bacterium]